MENSSGVSTPRFRSFVNLLNANLNKQAKGGMKMSKDQDFDVSYAFFSGKKVEDIIRALRQAAQGQGTAREV